MNIIYDSSATNSTNGNRVSAAAARYGISLVPNIRKAIISNGIARRSEACGNIDNRSTTTTATIPIRSLVPSSGWIRTPTSTSNVLPNMCFASSNSTYAGPYSSSITTAADSSMARFNSASQQFATVGFAESSQLGSFGSSVISATVGRSNGASTARRSDDDEIVNIADHVDGTTSLAKRKTTKRKPRSVDEQIYDRDLINFVQGQPLLWDPSDVLYRDVVKREEAWRGIGRELGMTWTQCRARWQDLRDRFVKLRNTLPPSGAAYDEARDSVKWPLYKLLEFLTVVLHRRDTTSNWSLPNDDYDGTQLRSPPPAKVKRRRSNTAEEQAVNESFMEATRVMASALSTPVMANAVSHAEHSKPHDHNLALGEYIAKMLASYPKKTQREMQRKLLQYLASLMSEYETESDA